MLCVLHMFGANFGTADFLTVPCCIPVRLRLFSWDDISFPVGCLKRMHDCDVTRAAELGVRAKREMPRAAFAAGKLALHFTVAPFLVGLNHYYCYCCCCRVGYSWTGVASESVLHCLVLVPSYKGTEKRALLEKPTR